MGRALLLLLVLLVRLSGWKRVHPRDETPRVNPEESPRCLTDAINAGERALVYAKRFIVRLVIA